MDRIHIRGGRPLKGTLPISGSKNATLPLMVASLLTDQPLTLLNAPNLADITTLGQLLRQHGVALERPSIGSDDQTLGRGLTLQARQIISTTAPYDLVRKMRASVLVLGPLLARCGQTTVSLPGGCAIGTRPVDLHLMGLRAMGAEIDLVGGYIEARAPQGLHGAEIIFPTVSVGATENLLMSACLAKGETVLVNAAREPEVTDLALCLQAMGADIEGIDSDRLRIRGKDSLHGATHEVLPDRIETGTYAMAAAITNGALFLERARLEHLKAVAKIMRQAGVAVTEEPGGVRVARMNGPIIGVDVMTEPYPGFPTDLQAQIMALMSLAEGAAMITETIFENRFMHVPELARMGANVTIHRASALVRGVRKLTGAPVMATDLRASVSLVLAGLAAQGETVLNRVYHIDRGYEELETKLRACGADIERTREQAGD